MSRTFSDGRRRDDMRRASRDEEPPDAAFRSTFSATVAVLLVLCAAFLGLGYFQGPQLSEAQLDIERATSQPNQQLRLFLNQNVESVDASQVTITPPVEFTVTTSGDLVAVQFAVPLFYDSAYRVEVSGLQAIGQSVQSTISYEFTTSSTTLVFLDRGDAVDEIVRVGLSGTDREVLFSAPGIQDFVVFEGSLVVTTAAVDAETGADVSELAIASLTQTASESIPLPGAGTIELLQAVPGAFIAGFTFTSLGTEDEREFDNTLMTIDFDAGRSVVPVSGLDGTPISVLTWSFIPGSSNILLQARDQSVFVIDPTGAASPAPLGRFSTLGRVSTDGASAVIMDPFGTVVLGLADLAEQRIEPSSVNGEFPYVGDVQLLAGGDRVQRVALINEETGRFASILVVDTGEQARVLYRTINDAGSIVGFTLSPNEQFVAIEVVPTAAGSVPDGRTVNPRATSITTIIVEVATGEIVKTVDGFALEW